MRRASVFLIVLAFALVSPRWVHAQIIQEETLDGMHARAKAAIAQNSYETAVQILTIAKGKFPDAPKVNAALGELYYGKELYALALEEYREAEKKGATDLTTLSQISRCYGKLGKEKSSIRYLTRILSMYPDSTDTIDDLGWMYFKTHQLEKGEKVLLDGIARLGMSRGMAMTLGTVYSALNNYDKSRKYYVKSIDEAVRAGDRNFAAIAYYNLSLLEHKFLHYNSALRTTDDSLAMEDRPSGHLARGELFQSRMDFRSALEEYQKAYAKDTTPLSKVNLGILFQRFGRLELARRYAEDAFASKDLAWMVYYGTDVSRHLKDIHTLLADVYWGLSRMEAGKPTVGPIERLAALLSSVRYMVLSWHNRQRYRLLALKVGGELLEQGSYENAYWEFYQGNMMYPEVGLKYLGMARKTETARLPHTRYFYLQEEGYVRRSAKLLEESIKGIDPFWEREALARSLAALAPLLEGQENAVRKREVLERLFEIDRGALQQEGLGLPLSVEFRGAGWGKREMGLIVRYMKRAYSECAPAMRHTLRINRGEGGNFQWAVRDSRSGGVVAQGTSPIAGPTKARCARLLRAILEELYAVH